MYQNQYHLIHICHVICYKHPFLTLMLLNCLSIFWEYRVLLLFIIIKHCICYNTQRYPRSTFTILVPLLINVFMCHMFFKMKTTYYEDDNTPFDDNTLGKILSKSLRILGTLEQQIENICQKESRKAMVLTRLVPYMVIT